MTSPRLAHDLIDFIRKSPTPFHAVQQMQQRLLAAGFVRLEEGERWQLQPGGRYLITRNDSSIIAFIQGRADAVCHGLRIAGAHTDSPCLRVKPNADLYRQGCWQLGVEVYGGALLGTWFDRDLGLAGRVSVQDGDGMLHHLLVDFHSAIGMIPSLAIHLDREVNNTRTINAQKDLPVLIGLAGNDQKPELKSVLLEQVRKEHPAIKAKKVLDYELSFYDLCPGSLYGINDDFIAAGRIDNLLSCFAAMQALIAADGSQTALLVCNDHEEVGSSSAAGAQGPMLQHCLQRLFPGQEELLRALSKSMMLSVDNAHAIHPNFPDKHDENHGPKMNAGPVIKINASQRYASNSETQAIFRSLCDAAGIPLQSFVVRSGMACGSTIGPVTAAAIGVKTLDIGVPTLAMHSIRETAGVRDIDYLVRATTRFFEVTSI